MATSELYSLVVLYACFFARVNDIVGGYRGEGQKEERRKALNLSLVPSTGLVCVGRVGGCRCPYQGHVSIPRNNEDFDAVAREDVPGMRSA